MDDASHKVGGGRVSLHELTYHERKDGQIGMAKSICLIVVIVYIIYIASAEAIFDPPICSFAS